MASSKKKVYSDSTKEKTLLLLKYVKKSRRTYLDKISNTPTFVKCFTVAPAMEENVLVVGTIKTKEKTSMKKPK